MPDNRRDPLDPPDWPATPAGPCTFGLDEAELAAEARRLYAAGWAPWELAVVLDLPGLADWALAR